jgi:hypothetical protein
MQDKTLDAMKTNAHPIPDRETILDLLDRFNRSRPGLEFGNYGDIRSYRQESRQIARDKRDADRLLCAVARSSITAESLADAFRAYSGRLTLTQHKGKPALDYCTGQYYPTEYRKAVAAVCSAALWDHLRESYTAAAKPGESAGDAIRRCFRREYGRTLADRWFN